MPTDHPPPDPNAHQSEHTAACLPASLCSWDYRVTGLGSGDAEVKLKMLSEAGAIVIGEHAFTVQKGAFASGKWLLLHQGQEVAQAHKPNLFRNKFLLDAAEQGWSLEQPSLFSRTFRLSENAGAAACASIEPMHAFTRRATIHHSGSVPEPVLLFAFWLSALMWRRQASSSSGAG